MRKTTLFIAMSLDGYIAGPAGNIDWLQGQNPGADDMVSYQEFIKDIDTIIMGYNTYHQITTELSPDQWFYSDQISYVFTHRELTSTDNIKFVNENVCGLIKTLRRKTGKGIWICGGSSVIHPLISENLIDRYHISIIPALIGDGIRLFQKTDQTINLRLIKSENYNGITDVIYEQR